MRLFDPVNTNSITSGSIYVSFVATANFVPTAGAGTYFATLNNVAPDLNVTNGFNFLGRIFQIGNTNAYPFTNTVPLTYRFGVLNQGNDPVSNPNFASTIKFAPIDLIRNVDYQVVMKYIIDNGNPSEAATALIWINPSSESDTAIMAGPTSDPGAVTNGLAGLLFRQRTGGGTVDIRDIAIGDSFADVVTNVLANTVVQVATNINVVTNYPGNYAALEVFATSLGGGPLTYQWYQISGGVTNAVGVNKQTYVVAQSSASDTGNYFCAVTNAAGNGALSSTNFYIKVLPDAGIGFTVQPVSKFGSVGGTLSLSCTVTGSGPLTYQWKFNGGDLTDGNAVTGNAGDSSIVSGSQTPTLVVSKISTNETGDYSVHVTSAAAVTPSDITSTNAHVVVNPPQPVSIAYLRSLEDPTTFQPTDTASVFSITGVITTFTNITSGSTASYYIQDATAGINLFVTGDASFRPTIGDIVSAAGTLSIFNQNLELAVDSTNPYQNYGITGRTNLVPAPFVFGPFSLTNNAGFMETNMEGRIVMLTNVVFTNASLNISASAGTTLQVTNAGGSGIFNIHFSGNIDGDVGGRTLPRFAWTITGPLIQFRNSSTYANSTYQIEVTRFGDIASNPPPAVTATASLSGNDAVLNWTAVPYVTNYAAPAPYSYTVLASPNVLGPYLPLASGLTFNTANGSYTDTNALLGPVKFYKIASP